MTIYHATDATFNNDLLVEGLTLVNFWAPWCGPCRMFAPVIEGYGAEGHQDAKILKVNIDENEETASRFFVMSIPTTILFKKGQPVDQHIGVMSKEGIRQFVSKHK
jgi:thioredoxin 1